MINMKKISTFLTKSIYVILGLVSLLTFYPQSASAGSLTSLSDTLSRVKDGQTSDHTIMFITPTGVTAFSQTIRVTFPTGFTVGAAVANNFDIAVSANASCTAPGSWTDKTVALTAAADTWGAAVSGQQVTLTAPASGTIGTSGVPAGRCVSIEMGANATSGGAGTTFITNQTVAQNTTNPIIAIDGTFGDTGQLAVEIIANDQVAVSATVDSSIFFSISTSTVGFGHLSTVAARYATTDQNGSTTAPANDLPIKLIGATNAMNGFTVSAKSLGDGAGNPGLYSATVSDRIPTAASSAVIANAKKYGLYAKNKTTNITYDAGFDNNSTGDLALLTTPLPIASTSIPTGNESFDLVPIAAVDSMTKAGVYADTLTIICTGNF